MWDMFKPQFVAPLVAFLCHDSCPSNGDVFEAAGRFYGKYQWQRSNGKVFHIANSVSIEDIRDAWNEISDMANYSSPNSMQGDCKQ